MLNMMNVFPVWGPYSKKYAGSSRIVRHGTVSGGRFDLSVAPAVSAFDIRVPNVTLPSACHPWECSPDYGYYCFRHELEWKDRVYADVSYTRLDGESELVRVEIFNNTSIIKNCVINYFCSLELPDDSYIRLSLPEKCELFPAEDYFEYSYAKARPWDYQTQDGMKRGVFRDKRFWGGVGLGDRSEKWHMPYEVFEPFGGTEGDRVAYRLNIKNSYPDAVLAVRYRTSGIFYQQGKQVGVHYICSDKTAEFELELKSEGAPNSLRARLSLAPTDEPQLVFLPIGQIKSGAASLTLTALGTGAAELDFFAVLNERDSGLISVSKSPVNFVPEIGFEKAEGGYLTALKYDLVDERFYLRVFDDSTRMRSIDSGALEDCMTARLSNADETFDDLTESFTGAFSRKRSDNGFFHNEITHTVHVRPGESAVRYAVISCGKTDYLTEDEYEKIYREKKKAAIDFALTPDGEGYRFSNRLLAAAIMTNVVYPIYKHGENIIHHTPGKRWDCLYTWDSGFIGLAMNEYAPHYSKYILDTYLSTSDNRDYAFLHHGSPVPVQIYQLLELLQQENDKESLPLYHRARLFYLFLSGRTRGSTTARFKSGLLTTYDYFYSSSGMDDYPAQVQMMRREKRKYAAPAITSSQVIRFAKILYMLADKLGLSDDKEQYRADIERLSDALERYSWDEHSGYYSYVLHDDDGNPTGKFFTEQGENLNKGLDGIYPLIAGICSEDKTRKIMAHLTDEAQMLSPFGISAVDRSASYFSVNGYWNGHIWFSHQWFIFKTMLDISQGEFAFEIARRALSIWKREVEASYYTFEMVNVVTGCSGWFHNFGGLSAPINLWLKAYYCPGTLNVGFDTLINRRVFSENASRLETELTYYGDRGKTLLLAVMSPENDYEAFLDGVRAPLRRVTDGALEVSLSMKKHTSHKLIIKRANKGE